MKKCHKAPRSGASVPYDEGTEAKKPMTNLLNAVVVWQDVPSSAVKELRLRADRSVTLEWQSGHYSTHRNVRKRDMLRLLNPNQSVGQWVNAYVL